MSEYQDYFTNPNYLSVYNALMLENAKDVGKGVVYIEDSSDVWFWRKLIERYFPNQYEYKTAIRNQQGKIALRQFYKTLNKKILVARDADYDWLFAHQDDLNHQYILHTFAYGKESVLIEKQSINEFFKDISHTHCHDVVMNEVIKQWSELIFMGLCWLTHQYLTYQSIHHINLDWFNKNFHLLDKNLILDELKFDIDVFNIIKNNINDNLSLSNDDMNNATQYLSKYGIDKNNAYRFISSHLLDEFVNKIHEQLCNQLQSKEVNEIKQSFEGKVIHERQKQLSHIFKQHFSLPTHYRQYLIDDNDEIHQRILYKIQQIG